MFKAAANVVWANLEVGMKSVIFPSAQEKKLAQGTLQMLLRVLNLF